MMGSYCSTIDAADRDHVEESTKGPHRHLTKRVNRPHHHRPAAPFTDNNGSSLPKTESNNNDNNNNTNINNTNINNTNTNTNNNKNYNNGYNNSNSNSNSNSNNDNIKMEESHKYDLVDAQDRIINERQIKVKAEAIDLANLTLLDVSAEEYTEIRDNLLVRESCLGFDSIAEQNASQTEELANRIVRAALVRDVEFYQKYDHRKGYGGQKHERFFGDHFLSNVSIIEETRLFNIAHHMPKGAHLHIHFNANLLPNVLLDVAKSMDHMYISSDIPLVPVGDDPNSAEYYEKFDECRIRFNIKKAGTEKRGNLFEPQYVEWHDMSFKDFLKDFSSYYPLCDVDTWLQNKLVFSEEEAHNSRQTSQG